MRIKHRRLIVWNLILFIILSYFFKYICFCLHGDYSALSKDIILLYFQNSKFFVVFGLASIISVFYIKKISKIILPVYFATVLGFIINIIVDDLDKLLILLSFLYIIFAFYISIFWNFELSCSFYDSKVRRFDFYNNPKLKIFVKLFDLDNKQIYEGYLTNWDNVGCCIKIDNLESKKLPKNFFVEVDFSSRKFRQSGRQITQYKDDIIGVEYLYKNTELGTGFSWIDLNRILDDLGLSPDYLS